MNIEQQREVCKKLGLTNGQFFAYNICKNLWWDLNGKRIGYGDISADNIMTIGEALQENEEFVGWNEHHGSVWQQTNTPMIRIKKTNGVFTVKYRQDIVREEGR